MNYSNSLVDGSVSRGLVRLALPILGTNILQCLNGAVSAFWVGRYLGEAALTAVVNAQSMMILLTGAAFGITVAATVLVGQCMGVHDVAGAKRVASTGVSVFSALSIGLTVLGLMFAEPLLIAMRMPPEAMPLAVPYIRVMLLALPSMYLLALVMSLLLGMGDSITPLRFVLMSLVLGIVLTPALMFGGNARHDAGVVGAAFATFCSNAVCLVALVRHLYRCHHPLCLGRHDYSDFRIDWSIVRQLVRMGVPIGAQVFVISLSSVLMIALVNRFGVDTTAAYGALVQLWNFILMPALAMAVAVSTMAAQNVGAQNWVRVELIARIGIGYSFMVTGAIVAIIYVADNYAYRIFLPGDSEALRIASHVNGIVTWSLAFMTIPLVLFGVVRAAGAVMVPLLVHVLSLLIVRYPLAVVLLERWQADAIWWSFTLSAGIDVVLATLYYRYGGWRRVE